MKYMIYTASLLLLAALGCKKEYEQAPMPYNDITSFSVGYGTEKDTINAIFTTDTVTVIWPAETLWPMPDSIAPQITLSEGATVIPASGAKVKFATGTTYTVKAQNGTSRNYVRKVVNGGAVPFFTGEPATPETRFVGSTGNVSFGNMRGNTSENKFVLVGANGTEYELISRSVTANSGSYITDTKDGTGVPAGNYRMKIINKFNLSATSSKDVIAISTEKRVPYAYFNHTDTIRVKAGQTFSIPVRHVTTATAPTEARFYYYEYGYITSLDLEFVEMTNNNTMATFRIPAGTPPLVSTLEEGIRVNSPAGLGFSQPLKFPVKVIE